MPFNGRSKSDGYYMRVRQSAMEMKIMNLFPTDRIREVNLDSKTFDLSIDGMVGFVAVREG